ncbi:hypothetical protein D5E79_15020 [Vibrio parahaemolyticus]|nr:hypothetical protein D5E79_15020 [Vibrio parahaemolyticus]
MDVEGDNSEGIGAAALESGLVGGLIGGGFGAPSGVAGRYRRRNFETKIEQAINPEVISQLRSVGKTDQEIEALLRPKIENRALSMGFDANESTALAHQALGAAMGKVPPAAERHATEDQAEAQQSVEPQQPEPEQPQQAQPQQPISEAAKQQEQAPVNLFSSDNHADLIRDGQQAVSAIKTWEKQDRGNDYAKQLRQDMSRYLATLNTDLSIEERQAAQRSMNSIYNEFLSAIGQKQKSPVDNEVAQAEMFDPETGEVMADSELYHSQDAQRDKFELSQSIQRGELGFVDEIAAQDENFKQGLQRAMEISPAAVLQTAKARRDGSMSQEQAISALQRVINSEELKQVDQLRPTDEESFLRDQQAQERNAQQQLENRGIRTNGYQPNVEETPEFQRNQARVLQGMRQQAQTNSFAGGHQPNGERDVTPLATGIENQRVYDAPQVEHTLKTKELNQSVAKERFAKAKTGKADNPRYQAYLDTLESEELEAINSNAGYMSWITHRIAEFRDENGIKKGADLTSSQHKEFDKYLRDYADRHLSERVKSERDSTAKKAENKPTQLKAIPATISRKAKGKLSKISTAQKKVEAAQENLDEVEMQHSTDRSGVDMAHPRVKAAQSRLRTAEKAEQDAYNELGEVWKEYRAKGGNEAVWDKFINENQGHLDANSWEDLNLDFGEDADSDVEIPEIPAKVPPFKDLSNPTVEELDALINYKQAEIAHYKARIANGENGEAMRLLINRLEGDIAKLEERKTNTKADKQEPSLIDTLQAVSDKYAENPTYRVKSYELEPAWKAVSKAMEEAGADTHDLYSFSNWITSQYQSDRQKAIDLAKSYLSDDKPEPTPPKGSKLKSSKATSNETDASKAKKGRSRPSGAREYLKAINALQSGEYTKEEAIELIDNYIDDVPALEEEFSQFTKPAIGNFFAQMGQWIDTSLRKDDLVKRAVKDIGNQFAAIQSDGGMFVVKSPSAMRNILSEMSDADYNKLAEKRKQQAIEREQEAERKKKALDNPQTLDDFQAYARANGGTIDAFNDQQLAEFDRLYTENQLSKLAEQEKRELERKAEVKAVETDGTIELSKVDVLNEAKGEQRYGAAFSEVDSDTFNDMRAKAKQLGGWYARAYKPKTCQLVLTLNLNKRVMISYL